MCFAKCVYRNLCGNVDGLFLDIYFIWINCDSDGAGVTSALLKAVGGGVMAALYAARVM